LHLDGTEYDEYKPYSEFWDRKAYETKLKNVAKVLNDLKADIVVLEEIESRTVLLELLKQTKYNYFAFDKKPQASIGIAIISKFPILNKEIISVPSVGERERNILKATIQIENKKFIVYGNHWRSKRALESERVKYALALLEYLKKTNSKDDYIIAGDLNSNYDEYITFKYDTKLNNTFGITGINQVLNTVIDGNFVTSNNILNHKNIVHFNPWLELPVSERFSSKFRNENNTPDHILLSKYLFDSEGISYKPNSFQVFKAPYLLNKKKIQRWNMKKKNGFSDHLPIFAIFTTDKIYTKTQPSYSTKTENKKNTTIEDLYKTTTLNEPLKINDLLVTYKSNEMVVFKGTNNDRAIQYYDKENLFTLGYRYDLEISEIDEYFGAKEIKKLTLIKKKSKVANIKEFHLSGGEIDLTQTKFQNEIIKNLKGIYKKGHLYYKNSKGEQKIKIYFKKDLIKPKEDVYLTIESGILSTYKSKVQIAINSNDDYKMFMKR
jgi:endonuclease/exonuclease/phosphatase family metal-dependent hydrolase